MGCWKPSLTGPHNNGFYPDGISFYPRQTYSVTKFYYEWKKRSIRSSTRYHPAISFSMRFISLIFVFNVVWNEKADPKRPSAVGFLVRFHSEFEDDEQNDYLDEMSLVRFSAILAILFLL